MLWWQNWYSTLEENLVAVVVVLKSQKEECHPGEDIVNASFHNDIKITTITWDSPNTANVVPFGGDWGGGGWGAELNESPWREYCQCLFHKNKNHYLGVPKHCKQCFIWSPGTLESIMSMLLSLIFSKITWASSKTVSSSPKSMCVLENGNCEKNHV